MCVVVVVCVWYVFLIIIIMVIIPSGQQIFNGVEFVPSLGLDTQVEWDGQFRYISYASTADCVSCIIIRFHAVYFFVAVSPCV